MMVPPRRPWLAPVLALGLLSTPVLAHHGWSAYGDEEFALTGSIQSVEIGNPHGVIKLRDKQDRVWSVILGPPARNNRAGISADLLPADLAITARGHRHRDKDRLEMKAERLSIGERVFDIYPERN